MRERKDGLADWGDYAVGQLRGPVATGFRKRLAAWRDPRARLLRRRRRAKQTTVAGASTTAVFGGGAYLCVAADAAEVLLNVASVGLGGTALVAAVGTVGAARQYRRLKRTPLPEPVPEPVELPPSGSQAREPMRRLRDAEQSLHASLVKLSHEGNGGAHGQVVDARATADHVAVSLRQVADRLVAVEGTIAHAPQSQQQPLHADVQRLRGELDDGVEGYGGLVAAAGRAVAASGGVESKHVMQDATDRLAGLAEALDEVSGRPGHGELSSDRGNPEELPPS